MQRDPNGSAQHITTTMTIRPLATPAECALVEELQREIWRAPDREIVPGALLLAAQRHGAVLLGAFAADQMIGFVFSFVGRSAHGRLQHHSHMAAVMPAYQNANIGYRLKLAQRDAVLAQGIDQITWTFDPLQSRNAYFNLHRLGAICRTYLPNLYGAMRDGLNAGLPSDRFEAEWNIRSAHVGQRLDQIESIDQTGAADAPVINPPRLADLIHPSTTPLPLAGERLRLAIPADYAALKAADFELAGRWRQHTRDLFEVACEAGYTAIDLQRADRISYYLLQRDWNADED